MLYKVTDDTLISSQSSLTNTTSQAPSFAGKKLKMMIHANLEFIENAKMMPKEMQTRLRSKVFSLGRICNELGRSAALEIDIILCFESEKILSQEMIRVRKIDKGKD